jgi:hypothetical protein
VINQARRYPLATTSGEPGKDASASTIRRDLNQGRTEHATEEGERGRSPSAIELHPVCVPAVALERPPEGASTTGLSGMWSDFLMESALVFGEWVKRDPSTRRDRSRILSGRCLFHLLRTLAFKLTSSTPPARRHGFPS